MPAEPESQHPKTPDMELAVVSLLNPRRTAMVPNVSWGLGLNHEADILALDSQGRFTEIEIKVSLSDLRADLKKWHGHRSEIISRLIYAVPESMYESAVDILKNVNCGIITVKKHPRFDIFVAEWRKRIKHNSNRPNNEKIMKFLHLACVRIWGLKYSKLKL